MKVLKVLTQNMLATRIFTMKRRTKHFLEDIKGKDFDIIFLQETFFPSLFKELDGEYHLSYVRGRGGVARGGLIIASKEKPKSVKFHKFLHQGVWISKQAIERLIEKGVLLDSGEGGRSTNYILNLPALDSPSKGIE